MHTRHLAVIALSPPSPPTIEARTLGLSYNDDRTRVITTFPSEPSIAISITRGGGAGNSESHDPAREHGPATPRRVRPISSVSSNTWLILREKSSIRQIRSIAAPLRLK